MKTEINMTDAIGKTLAAVETSADYPPQCVLVFTDGTFATLGIQEGYEPGDGEIVPTTVALFDFGDARLVRAGIVSEQEMAELRALEEARKELERQRQQEERDRREFERLKRKFEA